VVFRGADRRAVWTGLLAAGLLAAGYSALIGVSSRSVSHLIGQWRVDALFIVLVAGGFGTQIGLYSHARRALRGDARPVAVTAGGTATSTTAMVACCLHHLSDVVPLLGVSGAAAFLLEYKAPIVFLSLGANTVGIVLMLRALRHARRAADAAYATPACH
jgi:hypothetical protein